MPTYTVTIWYVEEGTTTWIQQEDAETLAEQARRRAEQLLKAHLNRRQRKEYAHDRSFQVVGADRRRYRIGPYWSGHVERLDGRGRAVERFCIHPRSQVPIPDNQLASKLMLETDPARFRRIANVTPLVADAG